MITFKHLEDIPKARLPTHLATYIDKLLTRIMRSVPDYNPENDGHIVLITPTDTDMILRDKFGPRYSDNMFDGASLDPVSRCYHAVLLYNNQFTVSIIIPDEPWLDPVIRERMLRETA